MEYINGLVIALTMEVIIICGISLCILINHGIKLRDKWNRYLRADFLDWRLERKKKAAERRVNTNIHKLRNLSSIEETPTPEMIALANRISADTALVKSLTEDIIEAEGDISALSVIDDDITLATLICNKIDEMIILETQNVLFPLASTGVAIDVRNLANYVETVATSVQAGLNCNVYNTTTILTPKYINTYIVKKSSVVVLTTMTNLNKDLAPNVK